MSRAELDELVEYGALSPINTSLEGDLFRVDCISPLRTAGKLRRDFDLDLFVVVILMDYLNRIETLEVQVRSLQARNH
jgi:chaperone modulatory protein CbpM